MKITNFVIVGGDKRQKYLQEYLLGLGFNVQSYGLFDWDEDTERFKSIITPESIIILPLPVSKTGKTVFMPFSKRELQLSRLVNLLSDTNTVFGGMISQSFANMLKEKNIPFYDYYDENFVCENAYLTAFGTLKIILEHIDFALPLGSFAVTGFGKVGREVALLLKNNSCDVTVFARSDNARNCAELHGCKSKKISELKECANSFDIIINTVPHNIFDGEILKNISPDCKIIELASAPFGVSERLAEKYSVNVIKASGLPGKYTAKTAGELIGKKIIKFLQKEENG